MIKRMYFVLAFILFSAIATISPAQSPTLHVLAFYSTDVERDHVDFALQAVKFFADAAAKRSF